ncbi:MAG: bifunctional hydroxymethylpyrimidine kinase/phosphomethylpyrimidine kinase [Abitibacteriaceae bacterium]|nr:bifunctional hydroxymethylpyrimidine kinase/phosphomethylpyrimidine kinase [Abditibacteriaceae bacterium]MBV9867516.1 bifunctional hydroxymethylpyrimidine kinase/phosphomethylpyrimidine kinase [Abditibacteriaceae bacterium]
MDESLERSVPCALAIGGLDPSGGAGLPADIRAMAAFGVHCCTVATAVIAQNTRGVVAIEPVSTKMFEAQLDNLLEDTTPRAIKVGMLPTIEIVNSLAVRLRQLSHIPLIVDTVFAPSSGPRFSDMATTKQLAEQLLPLAELVTPNIPEAIQLTGQPITDGASMIQAAQFIHHRYRARCVLIKGGHWTDIVEESSSNPLGNEAVDLLLTGTEIVELRAPRIAEYEVRGTGCLLASAIAAQRAQGLPVIEAAHNAKQWLTTQIREAKVTGHGRRVATL